MGIKVFTFGSCVSRDIFNHTYEKEFDVIKNIQRQSFFLMPMEGYPIKYEDIDIEKLNDFPWEVKMMINEVAKTTMAEIKEIDADLVVIDLIEERFDFAEFKVDDKTYVDIKSDHFYNFFAKYLADKAKNFKVTSIDNFSDEEIHTNFEKIIDVLLKKFSIDQIILLETYYSTEMIDDEGNITKYDNQAEIRKLNYRLSRVYKIMKRIFESKGLKDKHYTLLEAPSNNLGYKNHKWGAFPVHYQDSFYEDMGVKIKAKKYSKGE